MATVKGVKEKLHMPIYDAFFVPGVKNGTPAKTFAEMMTDPRVIRFFVDVQNKTRLETNLQAAGVLPSLNTFEARAMRVAASTFCPDRFAFNVVYDGILEVGNDYRALANPTDDDAEKAAKNIRSIAEAVSAVPRVTSHITAYIKRGLDDYETQFPTGTTPNREQKSNFVGDIVDAYAAGCDAAGAVLPELIYNSVTTLLVGEKIMIEVPTSFFPSGAGVSPGNGAAANHGNPDPMATFRFAEPVTIEPQQNFRVEMAFPQGVPGQPGVPGALANVSGPLRIWVILDGYLTRDVQ